MRLQPLFHFAIISALSAFACKAQLTFSGNVAPPVTESPDASSGLSSIYVLDNTSGVTASYTAASSSTPVRWMRFSSIGGGYAEEVTPVRNGNVTSVTLTRDDMGYIVVEGTSRKCYWVGNYANHPCELRGLAIGPEQDCMSASLIFSGA